MLEQFQAYINRYHLIAEGDRLVLALSGGIDSMVLADLLLKAKVDFVVAHCNFHLRDDQTVAMTSVQFSSVQSLSRVRLFVTP